MDTAREPAVAKEGWLRPRLGTLAAFARYVSARFIHDGCLSAAGALSYTTLLSLVPLIAIAFAVLSAVPILADTRDQLLAALFGKFVPEVGAETEYWFRYFAGEAVRTTTLGVLALAVTVVMLLGTIEDQLHNIWHVRSPRPWLNRILAYWAILTLGPLLLGTAFSLPSYLDHLARQTGLDTGALLATRSSHRILGMLPFLLETLAFTLLYELIPNCAVRWREALAGGVVTALLIDVLKTGFTLYIAHVASYRAVYGALAVIPIFLLWMYIVWGAVLFGAVVAAALPRWRASAKPTAAVARLGLSLALAAELGEERRRGGTLTTAVLAGRLGVAATAAEDDLSLLQSAGFVVAATSGGWVLTRALDSLTVLDFYRALGRPLDTVETAAPARPLSEVLAVERRSEPRHIVAPQR